MNPLAIDYCGLKFDSPLVLRSDGIAAGPHRPIFLT